MFCVVLAPPVAHRAQIAVDAHGFPIEDRRSGHAVTLRASAYCAGAYLVVFCFACLCVFLCVLWFVAVSCFVRVLLSFCVLMSVLVLLPFFLSAVVKSFGKVRIRFFVVAIIISSCYFAVSVLSLIHI